MTWRSAVRLGAMLVVLAAQCDAVPQTISWEPPLRRRLALNDGWQFQLGEPDPGGPADAPGWTPVQLPHTWNAHDVWDDLPGYHRGAGWYRRRLHLDGAVTGRRVLLHFEGVGQAADVFVNGTLAGRHEGGYTAFTVDLTPHVRPGHPDGDLVAVRADNAERAHLPPLSGDFNFYGGVYRDAWLITTAPVHVATDDHGSWGVFVDTPEVTASRATVRVRGTVVNDLARPTEVDVAVSIARLGEDGTADPGAARVAAATPARLRLAAEARAAFEVSVTVAAPALWTTELPRGTPPPRYSARVDVIDSQGATVVDRVEASFGIRTLRFDADTGFWLNGQRLPLRGTNRHQDRAGLGNALTDAHHVADLDAIKAMGANFVRLAHYPQDPAVLEAADRLGLLVWEEIPVVDRVTATPAFDTSCRRMLLEMIKQHYNHPSVAVWGYMNEILQKLPPEGESRDRYVDWVTGLARRLDALARETDPSRATALAVESRDIYETAGLGDIPQVLGFNLYHGWYYDTFDAFGRFLDRKRQRYPATALMVSEYGADGDTRIHSLAPVRYDYSAEYQRRLHEAYLPQIESRSYLAGAAVWVQNDFAAEHRGESYPHRNQKGLARDDRTPKDVYFLYQARWRGAPVVHIATRDAPRRTATVAARGATVSMPVEVYSNCAAVTLVHDGTSLGTRTADGTSIFRWLLTPTGGVNALVARADCRHGPVEDVASLDVVLIEPGGWPLAPGATWAVNAGSASQVVDAAGAIWSADRAYTAGVWGFEDGTGVERTYAPNVLGTIDDAVFQSYRIAPRAYRFRVPDGDYDLEVRLVEPDRSMQPGRRVFALRIDGAAPVRVDLAAEAGPWRAVTRTLRARAERGAGLRLVFEPIQGEPLVSAVKLVRR
ncbi:MAG: hypothetical protein KJ061_18515 [Vicinamibacteraceae bacterium]|nr:hypothetical protein [Vicinamibacteraceae bacterium]